MGGRALGGLMAVTLGLGACAEPDAMDEPLEQDAGDGSEEAGGDEEAAAFTHCEGTSPRHDVFNAFWSKLDTKYALFDIRLPDRSWNDVGEEGCASVTAEMTRRELFDVLISMAEELDDGHVQLEADDIDRDDDGWVSEYPHYEVLYELEFEVEENYLDGDLSWAANDWVSWGRIGDFGYVALTEMEDLSNQGSMKADTKAAREAMQQVLADLGDTQGIVVDVRANEGGWDQVALEYARFFAGPRSLAWSEQVRNGPRHTDFGGWEDWFVEESYPEAFDGPVVVLSSGGTFSAGEIFLLAMRVRPQVTVLGEVASGHLSDTFSNTLPNGWELLYSGERYRAADGEIYEATGIPVDIEVALDLEAYEDDSDPMLEAALATMQ